MFLPRRCLRFGACVVALAMGGCIIPDFDIDIEPERTNPGAVRIVQAVGVPERAHEACANAALGFGACPVPPDTVPPGLLQVEGQAFCVCQGGRDINALGGFDIFVEDPDLNDDGTPKDDIFGALLLDLDPDADDPSEYVAYSNYLPPAEPAKLAPLGQGGYGQPIERPATNLKSWALGVETSVDLCNNDAEAPVAPGLHSLRLVVTDRPWFVPIAMKDGKPERAEDAYVREDTPQLVGVPDLPSGATYAVANFVFECIDETSELGNQVCNCAEEADG